MSPARPGPAGLARPAGAAGRPARAGVTFIEILVVLAVVGAVSVGVWTLFGAGMGTSRRIAGTLDAQQVLRVRFQELVQQLQGARKLFYPTPGAQTQGGLGFVDAGGRAVMYFVVQEGGEDVLYRADLGEKTKTVLARRVKVFRASIPPGLVGEIPRTVHLTLGLEAGEDGPGPDDEERVLEMATAVTLRALDEQFPR